MNWTDDEPTLTSFVHFLSQVQELLCNIWKITSGFIPDVKVLYAISQVQGSLAHTCHSYWIHGHQNKGYSETIVQLVLQYILLIFKIFKRSKKPSKLVTKSNFLVSYILTIGHMSNHLNKFEYNRLYYLLCYWFTPFAKNQYSRVLLSLKFIFGRSSMPFLNLFYWCQLNSTTRINEAAYYSIFLVFKHCFISLIEQC